MIRTPSTRTLAERAVIYANAARSAHKRHKPLTRQAVKLTALALIIELRKSGKHIKRSTERALRT
jgi:predicted protein tyrosine phosphatase